VNERACESLLVLRSQCGDREALEDLLRVVQPSLNWHIHRMVGAEGAEDVLQETLCEASCHENLAIDCDAHSEVLEGEIHLLMNRIPPAARAVLSLHYSANAFPKQGGRI
jgi:DNA-directed RNA polymerase specialized sigma24 family protein